MISVRVFKELKHFHLCISRSNDLQNEGRLVSAPVLRPLLDLILKNMFAAKNCNIVKIFVSLIVCLKSSDISSLSDVKPFMNRFYCVSQFNIYVDFLNAH